MEEEAIQKSFLHNIVQNLLLASPHYSLLTHYSLIVINILPHTLDFVLESLNYGCTKGAC
jgi:hypothetical protein